MGRKRTSRSPDFYLSGIKIKWTCHDLGTINLVDFKLDQYPVAYVKQDFNPCTGSIVIAAFDGDSLLHLRRWPGSSDRKAALGIDLAHQRRPRLSGERVSSGKIDREQMREKSSLALR